jgi:competence protein ComEA
MEEKTSAKEFIFDFIRNNLIFVGILGGGLILCILGLFQYFQPKEEASDIQFIKGDEAKISQEVKGVGDGKIIVDVEGKVQKPGMYELTSDARIQDALVAAGGIGAGADRDYVSKKLNLAQKLSDGAKIYIPSVGEQQVAPVVEPVQPIQTSANTSVPISTQNNNGLININTASESQLDTLPKIGPVTAKKIIAARPYSTVEELVSKKVVSQKTFEGFRDKITVN